MFFFNEEFSLVASVAVKKNPVAIMHIYQVEMCCVWSCDDVARLSAKVHRSLKDGLPLFLVLFIDLVVCTS